MWSKGGRIGACTCSVETGAAGGICADEARRNRREEQEENMELPKDAAMLLSVVNMKLRDFYPSLEAFCEDAGIGEAELKERLAAIDYEYDVKCNQFV